MVASKACRWLWSYYATCGRVHDPIIDVTFIDLDLYCKLKLYVINFCFNLLSYFFYIVSIYGYFSTICNKGDNGLVPEDISVASKYKARHFVISEA